MTQFTSKDVGLYNPMLRFAFTNIDNIPFVSHWDGRAVTIPVGDTVELPHHLAEKFTTELVDKLMQNDAGSKNQIGIPAARKIWEDKMCRQLEVDEESPQVQVMRLKIKEELLADMARKPSGSVNEMVMPSGTAEFADATRTAAPKEKTPLKVPKIKVE